MMFEDGMMDGPAMTVTRVESYNHSIVELHHLPSRLVKDAAVKMCVALLLSSLNQKRFAVAGVALQGRFPLPR
jgi:hypothetical protein